MATQQNALFAIIVAVLGTSVHTTNGDYHPMSDEFIEMINSKQNSWRAGRNFHKDTPMSYFKNLMGVKKVEIKMVMVKGRLPVIEHDDEIIANLPEHFDSRDKWPNCPSLNEIRDQGVCGSCWAFGPVEVMTDRYCIFSNGTKNFHFSAQDVLSCSNGGTCQGGDERMTWKFWLEQGIVSGGNYNSNEGCKPYEIPPKNHTSGNLPLYTEPASVSECLEHCQSSYSVDYKNDKRYGKSVYTIRNNEKQIKAEIFMNGPVQVSFFVYSDFIGYKEGVYRHTDGEGILGHSVKILGWGVEGGEKYWLGANSWGTYWGDKGYFKFLRGEDHCGIESGVNACVPKIE